MKQTSPGNWTAFLVVGKERERVPDYGGGELQQWTSDDDGHTWRMMKKMDPVPGLIYNNPVPVITPDGEEIDNCLLFYGWLEPSADSGNTADASGPQNTGRAFLWYDGRYR
jgi:hypothetical protein